MIQCISAYCVFVFVHDAQNFSCCICNVLYVSVPMAVATESNAQMCVIFNTLYDGIFNNNLGKT